MKCIQYVTCLSSLWTCSLLVLNRLVLAWAMRIRFLALNLWLLWLLILVLELLRLPGRLWRLRVWFNLIRNIITKPLHHFKFKITAWTAQSEMMSCHPRVVLLGYSIQSTAWFRPVHSLDCAVPPSFWCASASQRVGLIVGLRSPRSGSSQTMNTLTTTTSVSVMLVVRRRLWRWPCIFNAAEKSKVHQRCNK